MPALLTFPRRFRHIRADTPAATDDSGAGGVARLRLGPAHGNPLGALHGGGIAILAEAASRAALRRQLAAAGAGPAPRALGVSLRIPRAVPVRAAGGAEVAVRCELLPRNPAGGPLVSHAAVEHAGLLCSVAEVIWAAPHAPPPLADSGRGGGADGGALS